MDGLMIFSAWKYNLKTDRFEPPGFAGYAHPKKRDGVIQAPIYVTGKTRQEVAEKIKAMTE